MTKDIRWLRELHLGAQRMRFWRGIESIPDELTRRHTIILEAQ